VSADALALGLSVGAALERAGIPYALGGALALGVHGLVRATRDVDLNVFVTASSAHPVLQLLLREGLSLDLPTALREAETEGLAVAWQDETRVDLFFPSIDLSWEALRSRVKLPVGGTEAWFLSAELLSCFKLLFFRPKDLVDLETLVAVNPDLDAARVRALMAETMGEDDVRVTTWDTLVRRVRAG
jgi:hypothetical protein